MHLVSCARPNEPLEDAPCSSLTIDAAKGAWTGYWSTMDEGYYARCQHPDGSEEWFRMYEEGIGIRATPLGSVAAIPAAPMRSTHQGVGMDDTTRARARRRVMLLLARSTSARGILVGSARPKSR
ncbi:MAG TPA: hypothetical protein VJN70_14435 [Gemmatimonadaceae bacterium]|jgi:hypothetical protein|nr:hypothetical protein [Gemmatimonadaceae bacterium]